MENGIKGQMNLFEYYPDLLPPAPNIHITDIQLEKAYKGLFPIRWMQKKVESADLEETIALMKRFATGGCTALLKSAPLLYIKMPPIAREIFGFSEKVLIWYN